MSLPRIFCFTRFSQGLKWRKPWFNSWVGKFPWRRDRLPTPVFLGFPGGSDDKESAHNAGDLSSIPGLGRYPVQYSCLENPHGQRSLVGYNPLGHKELGHDWVTKHGTAESYYIAQPRVFLIFLTIIYQKKFVLHYHPVHMYLHI